MRILATALMVLALCGFAVVSHAAEENVVHVKNPSPGEHVVVPCRDAKRIILDFGIEDSNCEFELLENNIVFHYDNGTIVTLEGILPSDGNLDKLGDVVLQIGQGEIEHPLRALVMLMRGELLETPLGPSPAARFTIGMPDKNARDATLGPYPSIVALYEAAKSGKAEAQYLWGDRSLRKSDGIFGDEAAKKSLREDAVAMFVKAAKQGHFHARCRLALLHADEPDSEWSNDADLLFAELSAKKHDSPLDMYYFAEFHAVGVGTSKNPEIARQGYARAALLGQPAACYALSALYADEAGIGVGDGIAELLLVRASELGLPVASGILAERYETMGLPLEPSPLYADAPSDSDTVVGKAWRKLWAAQDTGLAFAAAGEKYLKSKNLAKAIEYLAKGSDFGSAQAQFRLGECHEKGLGVAKNMDKAVALYKKASENGYEDAKKRLKALGK